MKRKNINIFKVSYDFSIGFNKHKLSKPKLMLEGA